MLNIGDKLKLLRESYNYTQEYVADQLGMSQSGYSRIESNLTHLNAEMLKRIAELFNVSPSELLSNQPSIVNFESTIHGQGIAHIDNFFSFQREFVEKMVASKDEQIAALQKTVELVEKMAASKDEQLATLQKTIASLQAVIAKLS